MASLMPSQSERSAASRQALLRAAREQFASRGYAAVSVEDVVRAAALTRGALYHQFPDGKSELFLHVVEQIEEELIATILSRISGAPAQDPLVALVEGMNAALEASLDPVVAQLTLLDAPAVLGWEEWRALGARYALGLVREVLSQAMDAGVLSRGPVDPLAQLLLAAVEEAALVVVRAPDPGLARTNSAAALARLVEGLRVR